MTADVRPVVIGAGPAGIRAAQALVAHGLAPVLVDEAASGGGQIYRQPPAGFRRGAEALYGFEARRARTVHAALADIAPRIDYRRGTLVWNAEPGMLSLLRDGVGSALAYTHLVIATGATDRVLPVEGWTTPGVFSLGGAQVALKFQGCAIGSTVAFVGTGPLLYLVAYQYAKAGVKLAGVFDAAAAADKRGALPALLAAPGVLAKGLYYLAWLRSHGVPLFEGARPMRFLGEARVRGLVWTDARGTHDIACDAVALGHGLRPETQVADLLGCRFRFDAATRTHVPERDDAGRTSVPGVYVAGDGAGILGADAAEWAGERAALALLQDAGAPVDGGRATALERRLERSARFRHGLERAFAFPTQWAAQTADDVPVCRCEQVSAGALRAAVHEANVTDINRLKALTRMGMGRCQGRMCGAAAAEILAHACGRSIAEVGRLRAQAPVKPIPFALSP